ncbi:unnamed protein product, partial [Porites lobata]
MHFKNGISDCVLSTGSGLFAFLGKFATMANNIAEDEQPESGNQQTGASNEHQENQQQLISEEEEGNLENRRVAEFINTLDEQMVKTLAIRALQRSVGSMDYVDSLLLMEPEDESNNSDQEPNVADDDASPLSVPLSSTQVID